MVRTRAPRRLEDIVEAATVVFLEQGLPAGAHGRDRSPCWVSPGLLYTYAEGKEALFQLAQLRELGVDISRLRSAGAEAEREQRCRRSRKRAFRELAAVPALEAALKTDAPTDARAELAAIVGEHYERLHRYRRFVRLAERSALDWPEMAERYYARGRQPHVRKLGSYIAARVASGHFAPVPDPEVAARFVIETVAWFANHRYGDHDGATDPRRRRARRRSSSS